MFASLAETVDPRHTALLLVDLQNDFCASTGALAATGADVAPVQAIVERAELLLKRAWSAGVLPIFVRMVGDSAAESEAWIAQRMRRTGGPFQRWTVAGTEGAGFYRLSPGPDEPVVDKYHYGALEGTKLDYLLRARNVRTVVVTGVATNVCVESTVREAFARDYHVVLVADCTAGTSPDAHQAALANLEKFFCEVVSLETITAAWASGSEVGVDVAEGRLVAARRQPESAGPRREGRPKP